MEKIEIIKSSKESKVLKKVFLLSVLIIFYLPYILENKNIHHILPELRNPTMRKMKYITSFSTRLKKISLNRVFIHLYFFIGRFSCFQMVDKILRLS
jgi:hypothetical protein